MADSDGSTFGLCDNNFTCIFCINTSDCYSLLPCLHTACPKCLSEFLGCKSSANSIFTCPACELKIQIPKDGIAGFKQFRSLKLNVDVETNCSEFSEQRQQEKDHVTEDTETLTSAALTPVLLEKVDCSGSDTSVNGNQQQQQQQQIELNENANNNFDFNKDKGGFALDKRKAFDLGPQSTPSSNICCPHVLTNIRSCVYCTSCDMIMCDGCCSAAHSEHNCTDLSQTAKQKKEYINQLLRRLEQKMSLYDDEAEQIDNFCEHLYMTKTQMKTDIQNRADHLCSVIQMRKQTLLDELENVCSANIQYYEKTRQRAKKQHKIIGDSLNFAKRATTCDFGGAGDVQLLDIYSEMTARLLHLIHQAESDLHAVEMFNIRLDVPEKRKEESHLEKLFGSLVQGNISCADVERVASFNIDLTWPVSLAITKSQDFVVVGKMGAFEASGRIMFYSHHGRLLHCHELESNRLPYDVVCLHDGSILMSDNWGQLSTYAADGSVVCTWQDMFKGIGRLAVTNKNEILVTSSEQHSVLKYTNKGDLLASLPDNTSSGDNILQEPHYVATNDNDDVIVSDFKQNCIFIFDSAGTLLLRYGQDNAIQSQLKCLFALCCDPFNNMLVADFPNDQIYLVSPSGQFLGCLLTKKNGISCPNFVTLDHAGRLFVGQYGGEILVFRYLSCLKHA